VALACAAAFAGACWALFTGLVPLPVLTAMQMATIFVMATCSRLPQILLNIRRGNAGMMSLTTCVLNVAGNSVRIFTTLVGWGARRGLAAWQRAVHPARPRAPPAAQPPSCAAARLLVRLLVRRGWRPGPAAALA
jgi:hypothetical protein